MNRRSLRQLSSVLVVAIVAGGMACGAARSREPTDGHPPIGVSQQPDGNVSAPVGSSPAPNTSTSVEPDSPPLTAEAAAPPGCGATWNATATPKTFPKPKPKQRAALAARCRRTSSAAVCLEAAIAASVGLPSVSWASIPEQVASIDTREEALKDVMELSERACKGGDVAGCAMLGLTELQSGAEERTALSRIEDACNEQYARACRWLGQHHYSAYQPDNTNAFAYYDRACEMGDVEGCTAGAGARMGIEPSDKDMVPSERDTIRRCGIRMAHELCEAGHALACTGIGFMHLDGKLVEDASRALGYFERACTAGDSNACRTITDLYGSRALWESERAQHTCQPEPRYAPLTVIEDDVPRLATAEPALVAAVRKVEKEMADVLARHRQWAAKTAKSLSGDAQCRGRMNNCACRGPASKCVPHDCRVTRNDGVRLFIECTSSDGYGPKPSLMGRTLMFRRVGNRLVPIVHMRELFPGGAPMAKTKLVGACGDSGGVFQWSLAPSEQDGMSLVMLAPKHLYVQEYHDWRAARCAVRYGGIASLVGCGPLAALAGRAPISTDPLGYTSAPLAWADVHALWPDGADLADADFVPFSSHLPQHQGVVASLNAWVQKHRDCALQLSTDALVSASCGAWHARVNTEATAASGWADTTRVVRLRDGKDVTLAQVLPQPARQLPLIARACFANVGTNTEEMDCYASPSCLRDPGPPVDARPVLTMQNIRGFTLKRTGVEFWVEAGVKQNGKDGAGTNACTIPWGTLGLSLVALGR